MPNRIQHAIEKIDNYVDTIYKDYGEGMIQLPEIVKEMQEIIIQFLSKIEKYNQYGEDIQVNVILNQLDELLQAIKWRDPIQMVDTLEYEIKESLIVYEEMVCKYGE